MPRVRAGVKRPLLESARRRILIQRFTMAPDIEDVQQNSRLFSSTSSSRTYAAEPAAGSAPPASAAPRPATTAARRLPRRLPCFRCRSRARLLGIRCRQLSPPRRLPHSHPPASSQAFARRGARRRRVLPRRAARLSRSHALALSASAHISHTLAEW